MALNKEQQEIVKETLYDCVFTGEEMQQNAIDFAEHMLYVGFALLPVSILKDIIHTYGKIYIKDPEKMQFDSPETDITRITLHGYFEILAKVLRDRKIAPILRVGVEYEQWTRDDALKAMRDYLAFKLYRITFNEHLYAEIVKLVDALESYTVETMYWCLAANETTKTYQDYPSTSHYLEDTVLGGVSSKKEEC